jgi:hypothetical protein
MILFQHAVLMSQLLDLLLISPVLLLPLEDTRLQLTLLILNLLHLLLIEVDLLRVGLIVLHQLVHLALQRYERVLVVLVHVVLNVRSPFPLILPLPNVRRPLNHRLHVLELLYRYLYKVILSLNLSVTLLLVKTEIAISILGILGILLENLLQFLTHYIFYYKYLLKVP